MKFKYHSYSFVNWANKNKNLKFKKKNFNFIADVPVVHSGNLKNPNIVNNQKQENI